MSKNKIFMVGLDAADKDLIEKWSDKGYLPNFQRLLTSSIYGDVNLPRGLEAGSVWPSLYFGLRPGNMEQYDGARVFDSETYDHKSYQPNADSTKPIWTILSEAGKRCAVIDVPYNDSVDNINGIKVVDRGGHVPAGGGNFLHLRTQPAKLAEEIISLFGEDPAGGKSSDYFPMDTAKDIKEFVRIYTERIEKKTDMLLHLWNKESWDFFMSVYSEAHCAGHRCWHLHDESHALYDAKLSKIVGNPLRDIYIALDHAVGRLLQKVEGEASVILYLSHGMGPRHSGTRVLDRVLSRLDNQVVATRSGIFMNAARQVWRIMPETLRKPFLDIRNSITNDGFQPNRSQRRFFEVYANDRTAGVRLNLVNREVNGVVSQLEYDAVCADLMGELKSLKNPESGELVIREVLKTHDVFDGPFINSLPDILVTWNRSHPINYIESATVGTVDNEGIDMKTRTGDHRIKGRFFALNNKLASGKLTYNVETEDFAATIAELMSVKFEHTDGKPIDAFSLCDNTQILDANNPSDLEVNA